MDNNVIFKCEISDENKSKTLAANIYTRWIDKIYNNFDVEQIIIHSVIMFGSRVGFIFAEAVAHNRTTGKRVPGVVFLRGDAVSIMPVLHCGDKTYTVMVTESRIPVGRNDHSGLPAGMIDDGSFVSAALRELVEEVGSEFNVTEDDLIDFGKYPVSAGGSDEYISLMAFERHVDEKFIEKLNGRVNSQDNENEHIIVNVCDIHEIPNFSDIDMRSVLSYYKWMEFSKGVK